MFSVVVTGRAHANWRRIQSFELKFATVLTLIDPRNCYSSHSVEQTSVNVLTLTIPIYALERRRGGSHKVESLNVAGGASFLACARKYARHGGSVVIRGQPASQPVVKDVPPFRGSLQKISLISRAKLLWPLRQ